MLRNFCFLLFIVILFSGCEFRRENAEQDQTHARQLAIEFYTAFENGETEELAKRFRGNATEESAMENFTHMNAALGKLVSYNVLSMSTEVVTKGDKTTGVYYVNLKCRYDSAITNEVLTIILEGEDYYYDDYDVNTQAR